MANEDLRIKGINTQGGLFPENQPEAELRETLDSAKPGDVVHIVLKGQKLAFYNAHHLLVRTAPSDAKQVHGVVQDTSAKGKVTLWGPWFSFSADETKFDDEARTFGLDDVEVMVLEPAESYIPAQSEGKFTYLGSAVVQTTEGSVPVVIDSYIEGFVSGFEPSGPRAGNRITAPERWFTPIDSAKSSSLPKTSD